MKILCCIVLVFTGGAVANVQPKSVNLALETVLQFDKTNHAADLEVITKVQNFLDTIKNAISVYNGSRRSITGGGGLKFTDFVLEVVHILRSYNDSDLKELFRLLDDESRKYNYKGCKFYELLNNHDLRKFVSRNLEGIKETPLEELRSFLNTVASAIESHAFKGDEEKLISLVNSLYSGSEKRFDRALSNLQRYGTRRSSSKLSLREIVSNGLRSVIFEFFSNLNPNARESLRTAVHEFWERYKGGKEKHRYSNENIGRQGSPRASFIEVTRFQNSDMHEWSKRNKLATKPALRTNKHPDEESLGLTVDLHAFKPVFQSFINKIAKSAILSKAIKKKKSSGTSTKKEKSRNLKTKHKHAKHSKHENPVRSINKMILPDSFETSDRDSGHGISKTKMEPYDEYETTTAKGKRSKKSRHKGQVSLENHPKFKSDIGSEVRALRQNKYGMPSKFESNLSPEIKDTESSDLEFLVGGQKTQGMKRAISLRDRKRGNDKDNAEGETVKEIVSEHQAVIEVTESKELMPKSFLPKRGSRPSTTTKKFNYNRKIISRKSMDNLKNPKMKLWLKNNRKSVIHTPNEGLTIESFEDNSTNTLSVKRRIGNHKKETGTKNSTTQSTTDRKVYNIIHKLQKELDDYKARMKLNPVITSETTEPPEIVESPESTETPGTYPVESTIADTGPTDVILSFWGPEKTTTRTTKTTTSKIVTRDIDDKARRELEVDIPLDDVYSKLNTERPNNNKLYDDAKDTTNHDSKYLRDHLFTSNNVTYRSKVNSPLQVLLNKTMEKISSYLNETTKKIEMTDNATDTLNSFGFDDDSDQISKSNERPEIVPETKPKLVTKASKMPQEASFEEDQNETKYDDKPKTESQSLEDEKRTTYKEKVKKASQSSEGSDKTAESREKVGNATQIMESIVSKKKVEIGSQSSEEVEKTAASIENENQESLYLQKNKNNTIFRNKEGAQEKTETTTPNQGNASLSTPINNDVFNNSVLFKDSRKNFEEEDLRNKSSMIPSELLSLGDIAQNDLLEDDPFNDLAFK